MEEFTFNALFNYQVGGHAYDFAYAALMDNDYLVLITTRRY